MWSFTRVPTLPQRVSPEEDTDYQLPVTDLRVCTRETRRVCVDDSDLSSFVRGWTSKAEGRVPDQTGLSSRPRLEGGRTVGPPGTPLSRVGSDPTGVEVQHVPRPFV